MVDSILLMKTFEFKQFHWGAAKNALKSDQLEADVSLFLISRVFQISFTSYPLFYFQLAISKIIIIWNDAVGLVTTTSPERYPISSRAGQIFK